MRAENKAVLAQGRELHRVRPEKKPRPIREVGSWATRLLGELCVYACESRGAGEESIQARGAAVTRRARKQRHRNDGVGSACGCSLHQQHGTAENTRDLCPLSPSSLLEPTAQTPLWADPKPLPAPVCGTDHAGGLCPSVTRGMPRAPGRSRCPFTPRQSRAPCPQRAQKVPVPASTSRQQGPGQDFPKGDVCGVAKAAFREGSAGRNLLQAQWDWQSVGDRGGQQRQVCRVEDPEKTQQPEPAARDGRRQTLSRGGCAEFADTQAGTKNYWIK